MKITDLKAKEFDPYYGKYIKKLSDNINLREGFSNGKSNVIEFFNAIPKEKLDYRYDKDKWTIKEVLQHLIDTERIFIYRCFRIARNDKTSLAGYDQNIYIKPSGANQKSREALIEEFRAVRLNSISLLKSLSDEMLCAIGDANGGAMSARAAAFVIIGHDIWHMAVIKEKYL